MKNDYLEFLESKKHTQVDYGIKPNFIPDAMFDYQKHVAEYAIKKGRCAVFLDTGLGKTIIELVIAKNYIQDTNKPVLIITPLAVAFQFIKEAEKFGIDDISYSKDGKYKTKIVVCNYERLDNFNSADFDCVLLDESSILKNFDGAIKQQVTNFLRKVKYRFLFTATPSPNDFIELGTSSEALGYLGYTDMLTKFFKNNNNNTVKIGRIAQAREGVDWYLKAHAEKDFWRWIASWSISMRKPSDLGYNDDRHILPELHEVETIIRNENPLAINGQHSLFALPAQNFFEIKAEVRSTITQRCEMAF
jgi:superfamily II DNA or RNA helicase